MRGMRSMVGAAGLIVAAMLLLAPGTEASHKQNDRSLRHVMFVGNNWDGTVDVFHPRGRYRKITRINVIPDKAEREAEIFANPVDLGFFLGVRELIGEGHDQYADDMYTSPDGQLLVISRPSYKDVVGIDMFTKEIVWRFEVDGQRSDHMAVSPDGKSVAVSASTGNVVHILDIKTGEEVGKFDSGDSPHENVYSADGSKIFHASIGRVYTPTDRTVELGPLGSVTEVLRDTSKGDRRFQVVDAKTNEIISQVDMGEKLAEAGFPGMSSAVRPMTITEDERFAYLQVSFFHGFVKYDLVNQKVVDVVDMPLSEEAKSIPQEQYLLDSAHHGIALGNDDQQLCIAGTTSDYAAIVDPDGSNLTLITGEGTKPYWSTESNNGKRCFVSWSGTDNVSAISYKRRKVIKTFPVGDHPQRIRQGNVQVDWIRNQQGRFDPDHNRRGGNGNGNGGEVPARAGS